MCSIAMKKTLMTRRMRSHPRSLLGFPTKSKMSFQLSLTQALTANKSSDVFSSDNDGMLSEPEVAESKASSKKYVKYSFLTVMLLMDKQGGFQGTETASPVSLFDFFSSAYFMFKITIKNRQRALTIVVGHTNNWYFVYRCVISFFSIKV